MKTYDETISSAERNADSDSVNLGSNPSPPATQNYDISRISECGQDGHNGTDSEIGRTEAGTFSGEVYFISDGTAIKIGYSGAPTHRIQGLQTSHHVPLRILGSFGAEPVSEKIVHSLFDSLKIRGEWFRPAPELMQFIKDHCKPKKRRAILSDILTDQLRKVRAELRAYADRHKDRDEITGQVQDHRRQSPRY